MACARYLDLTVALSNELTIGKSITRALLVSSAGLPRSIHGLESRATTWYAGGGERLPHILHLSIPGIDQEAFVVALDLEGIAVSVASACQSGAAEPSHVLAAMGRVLEKGASVRISLGHATTARDIDRAADTIPDVANRVLAAV